MNKDIETLIERLIETRYGQTAISNDNHIKVITEAIATLRRLSNPWVPIADIPEEWKDGRAVWLYFVNLSVTGPLDFGDRFAGEFERIKRVFPDYCCWQKANWSKHNGGGWVWGGMSGRPFFAMLPPDAPKG